MIERLRVNKEKRDCGPVLVSPPTSLSEYPDTCKFTSLHAHGDGAVRPSLHREYEVRDAAAHAWLQTSCSKVGPHLHCARM